MTRRRDFFATPIADPGRPRAWIAPSALAIHLCIGQVYAFSVFNLPLSKALGITRALPTDWKLTQLGWIFSVAIAVLGISAATFGTWVERVGPRASGFASALSFGCGLSVAALGVHRHALPIVIGGYGVLGGIGLGLGYITPVSTLIKWFPDRRGMATGIAIMGFGGGAIAAAPISRWLITCFASSESVGVAETFLVLGAVYTTVMVAGALSFRLPAARPQPTDAPTLAQARMAESSMTPRDAIHTRQFALLWVVLCFNVTAGIGVLGQASAMIQEMFKGRVGEDDAAKFVSFLSVANMLGRFVWASLSDRIGRRATYAVFFSLGPIVYLIVPMLGGRLGAFVICFGVILTMYGGGFATIPAYLSDLFGTQFVSAIHGRLLTAWSVAGVLGPVLVNYMRQHEIEHGVAKADAYNLTMRLMAGLLILGFVANALVKPVDRSHRDAH